MLLKRFSPYFAHLKTVRLQFAVGLLAGILAAAASGAGLPLVIEYIVPTVSGEDAPSGLALLATLAIIPGVFAFRALGTFLNAYYMAHAGMHVLERGGGRRPKRRRRGCPQRVQPRTADARP